MSHTEKPEPVARYAYHDERLGHGVVHEKCSIPIGTDLYAEQPHAERIAELEAKVAELVEYKIGWDSCNASQHAAELRLRGENREHQQRIAELERQLDDRSGLVCGDCDGSGWLEDRAEGRYPCTCMTEAEPYQLLERQNAELLEAKDQAEFIVLNCMLDVFDIMANPSQFRAALAMAVDKRKPALGSVKGNHSEQPLDMVDATSAPALVFYPAGSLGEAVEKGGAA